jgi:hypothetical protein
MPRRTKGQRIDAATVSGGQLLGEFIEQNGCVRGAVLIFTTSGRGSKTVVVQGQSSDAEVWGMVEDAVSQISECGVEGEDE